MTVEQSAAPPAVERTAPFAASDLVERWPTARVFVVVALLSTVAGGVVAAVSTPTHFGHGPWTAAFLVLILGVAQIALGGGQAWLAAEPPAERLVGWELATWNLGGAGVIVGTLAAVPALTTLGGIVEVASLALFLAGVRRTGVVPRWARVTYRAVLVVVVVSIPVGLVLAWVHPNS